jgi:hypothetical protein
MYKVTQGDHRNPDRNAATLQKCRRSHGRICVVHGELPTEGMPTMRTPVIALAMMLLTCSAGFAQQASVSGTGVSDMSATPQSDSAAVPALIGATATQAALGGAGIPLGTTELFAGGLSPTPTDGTLSPTCPGASATPGVGALGTGSIFSSNGTLATSTSDIASSGTPTDSGCGTAASAGAGPLGLTSALGAAPVFTGGSVPLGATALGTAGLSGTIGVAPPSPSPCNLPGSVANAGLGLPALAPLSRPPPTGTC